MYGDEREAVKRESGAADGRDPFPPDLVRQVPQGDLTRYRDQADKAQGPGPRRQALRQSRSRPDIWSDDLHGIPDEHDARIAQCYPSNAVRTDRAGQGPYDRDPGLVHDPYRLDLVQGIVRPAGPTCPDADVHWPFLGDETKRRQQDQNKNADRPAGGTLAFVLNQILRGR